jgi:hypothetical protein
MLSRFLKSEEIWVYQKDTNFMKLMISIEKIIPELEDHGKNLI